jgi:hypothetical protein
LVCPLQQIVLLLVRPWPPAVHPQTITPSYELYCYSPFMKLVVFIRPGASGNPISRGSPELRGRTPKSPKKS